MADFVTRKEIKNTLLVSLKSVLEKREADIKLMQAKEAKGHEKLEKSSKGDKVVKLPDGSGFSVATVGKVKKNEMCNDNGVLPDLGKDATTDVAPPNPGQGTPMNESEANKGKGICLGCTGSNLESLGVHMGHDHYICKDCGEVGATIKEQNEAAEMAKEELDKVTPPGEEKLVHKLKDEYGEDKEGKKKAYATAWAIHNKSVKDKKKADVEKRELASVENARQAVGIAGNGPKMPSVNKPKTPNTSATAPVKDAFNTGGANNAPKLGKAEKTPFNDGAGTTGKPHEEIPGSDVGVDKARKNTQPPVAGKVIPAKGSGGDVSKTKMSSLSKEELAKGSFAAVDQKAANIANKPAPNAAPVSGAVANQPQPAGIIPTAREQGNAKKGVTSLATIRQRWHGAGKMDTNDIAAKLKPMMDNLPHLHAAIDKLAGVLGGIPKAGNQANMPLQTVSKGKYQRAGANGSFKQVDQTAQNMGKAEGIPAAPKSPGAKAASITKAPMPAQSTPSVKTTPKL